MWDDLWSVWKVSLWVFLVTLVMGVFAAAGHVQKVGWALPTVQTAAPRKAEFYQWCRTSLENLRVWAINPAPNRTTQDWDQGQSNFNSTVARCRQELPTWQPPYEFSALRYQHETIKQAAKQEPPSQQEIKQDDCAAKAEELRGRFVKYNNLVMTRQGSDATWSEAQLNVKEFFALKERCWARGWQMPFSIEVDAQSKLVLVTFRR
jgi:hypothetical protein